MPLYGSQANRVLSRYRPMACTGYQRFIYVVTVRMMTDRAFCSHNKRYFRIRIMWIMDRLMLSIDPDGRYTTIRDKPPVSHQNRGSGQNRISPASAPVTYYLSSREVLDIISVLKGYLFPVQVFKPEKDSTTFNTDNPFL